MPWTIRQSYRNCNGYAVVKESDGSIAGCHVSRVSAVRQIAALEASEAEKAVVTNQTTPNRYPQPLKAGKGKKKKMEKSEENTQESDLTDIFKREDMPLKSTKGNTMGNKTTSFDIFKRK